MLISRRTSIPLLYMLLIFIQSSFPAMAFPHDFVKQSWFSFGIDRGWFYVDDVLHIIEYGILGYLWGWALNCTQIVSGLGMKVWTVGSLYGLSDELHQIFIPHRDSTLRECIVDSLGTGLGLMLWVGVAWFMMSARRIDPTDGALKPFCEGTED